MLMLDQAWWYHIWYSYRYGTIPYHSTLMYVNQQHPVLSQCNNQVASNMIGTCIPAEDMVPYLLTVLHYIAFLSTSNTQCRASTQSSGVEFGVVP